MRVFLLSLDLNLWHIVENGFEMSSLLMNHWNDLEKKMFSLNAKAMNALFCALDRNEFNRVSLCEMTSIRSVYISPIEMALLTPK